MSLSPREQLAWSLSHGHEMMSFLTKDEKSLIEKMKNNAEKPQSSIQKSNKIT